MRQFIRGERAKLADLAAINHLWEVGVSVDAPFFIVDFCCLGLDAAGQVVDDRYLVSFNQPNAPQDAIEMDNASNNGAVFNLNLNRLPGTIRRVVFTATLHQPEMPGGLLGAAFSLLGPKIDVGPGHITLSTPVAPLASFAFSGEDFQEQSTLILGEFYWRDEWRFVAAGQPLKGELHAFLQTLTDGPTPAPAPLPPPRKTAPVAAPPRQTRAAVAPAPAPRPKPPAPQPLPVTPHVPIATSVRPPAPAMRAPLQPVVESLSPAPTPVPVAAPPAPTVPFSTSVFAQSVPDDANLQDLIDGAAPGSTLTLARDEYEGPIIINKTLVLEGRDSALWAKIGPIVTISAPDVVLRNLDIEITVAPDAPDETGVALKIEGQNARLQLDNVRVRGRIFGLGDEDGTWILPPRLDLGSFAPRANNDFRFSIQVPTPVQLSSPVEGVTLSPAQLSAGTHQISLSVRDVAPETLLIGSVEVRSASLVRTILLTGNAVIGATPKLSHEL